MVIHQRINKKQSFDLIPLLLVRLKQNFEIQFRFGGMITKKECYRICGCWFSLKKTETRKAMKILSLKHSFIEWNTHGLVIKRKGDKE